MFSSDNFIHSLYITKIPLMLIQKIFQFFYLKWLNVSRLPRPASPPVVRMEKRYELEYGMPSTHAMIGLAFPWAFLYFTIQRYEVSDLCDTYVVV